MTTLHCILTLANAITFAVQTISSVLEAVLVLKHTCRNTSKRNTQQISIGIFPFKFMSLLTNYFVSCIIGNFVL